MRYWSLVIGIVMLTNNLFGQSNLKQYTIIMNKLLGDFTPSQVANINLIESSGLVTQVSSTLEQRYNLNEMSQIDVISKDKGFLVNLLCSDSGKCVSLVRDNGKTVNLTTSSYYFTLDAAANTFAESALQLIQHYRGENNCQLNLFTNAAGKTNRLKIDPKKIAENKKTNNEDKQDGDDAVDLTKQKHLAIDADEGSNEQEHEGRDMSTSRFDEEIEKVKQERKAKMPAKEKEETSDINIDDDEDKKVSKRKNKGDEASDIPKPASERKEKEDEHITEGDEFESNNKVFCNQVLKIIEAQNTQFKTIEGKVTNAEKKINESTLKLKGAKRNYLSFAKNKRTFIAEYRVSSELDLMNIEYDKLQTQLENCLPGNWDDIDHAEDDEYANIQEQVRDFEYKSQNPNIAVSFRIIMFFDGKKYILFMRAE